MHNKTNTNFWLAQSLEILINCKVNEKALRAQKVVKNIWDIDTGSTSLETNVKMANIKSNYINDQDLVEELECYSELEALSEWSGGYSWKPHLANASTTVKMMDERLNRLGMDTYQINLCFLETLKKCVAFSEKESSNNIDEFTNLIKNCPDFIKSLKKQEGHRYSKKFINTKFFKNYGRRPVALDQKWLIFPASSKSQSKTIQTTTTSNNKNPTKTDQKNSNSTDNKIVINSKNP